MLDLLLTAELEDLKQYLSETDAASLTSDKTEKTSTSIRSVIATNLKSLRFLIASTKNQKPPFCIKDWIVNEKDLGWLFLTSTADQLAALKPLISMWFSMATISLLSLPESYNRRIWFICDELPTLNRQPQLAVALAEARKFGGCFVLGMQSIAQLAQVYGTNSAKAIYDLLNTAFYFRSPTSDMAELVSRDLGSQEIEDMRENYSYGANTIRDGISISGHRITTPLVFVAEIMMLKDLHFYLKLPGPYPISLHNLKLEPRAPVANHFIAEELELDNKLDVIFSAYETNDKGFAVRKMSPKKTASVVINSPTKATRLQKKPEEASEKKEDAKLNDKDIEAEPILVDASTPTTDEIKHLKQVLQEIEFKLLSILYSQTKGNLMKGIELNRRDLSLILNRGKSSISRATMSLCQKSLITTETTQSTKGKNVNVYKVNIDKIQRLANNVS